MLMGGIHSLLHCLVYHHNDINKDAVGSADDDQMCRWVMVMGFIVPINTLRPRYKIIYALKYSWKFKILRFY